MIWLSERLVVWIRKTSRSHGAKSSHPWVIDLCTVLTFWSWWLRKPGPVWSPESGSSGWLSGPHSKLILGDPCPEHRAVVNSQLGDLEILIVILMWNSRCWERLNAQLSFSLLFLYYFIVLLPCIFLFLSLAFMKWRLEKQSVCAENTMLRFGKFVVFQHISWVVLINDIFLIIMYLH